MSKKELTPTERSTALLCENTMYLVLVRFDSSIKWDNRRAYTCPTDCDALEALYEEREKAMNCDTSFNEEDKRQIRTYEVTNMSIWDSEITQDKSSFYFNMDDGEVIYQAKIVKIDQERMFKYDLFN